MMLFCASDDIPLTLFCSKKEVKESHLTDIYLGCESSLVYIMGCLGDM